MAEKMKKNSQLIENEGENVTDAIVEKKVAKKKKRTPAIVRFFQKIGKGFAKLFKKLGGFLKDCKSEMKKVVWYGRKQTINNSVVVLVVILIAGAAIILLDIGLLRLLNFLAVWMPGIQQ